ncbi:MAG: hypothetical protein IRY99_24020 [Isosphaeraceae bacterium]|nr:hypothetical protein [Isosphaeraceae bacterium]
MIPRDWFVLGIRLFGIWLITCSASYLMTFCDFRFGLVAVRELVNPHGYLLYATSDLILALIFLRGAQRIAAWCDGEAHEKEEKPQDLA